MSWTIRRSHFDDVPGLKKIDEDFNKLKDVLKFTTNPPLLFCAASDDGTRGDSMEEFPSAIAGDVFRIGAAQETGHTWPNVSQAKAVHFVFPGVDFTLEENSELRNLQSSNDDALNHLDANSSRRSGSSVATALAAGLAALLIHCTKLGAYHTVEKKGVLAGNSVSIDAIKRSRSFQKHVLIFLCNDIHHSPPAMLSQDLPHHERCASEA